MNFLTTMSLGPVVPGESRENVLFACGIRRQARRFSKYVQEGTVGYGRVSLHMHCEQVYTQHEKNVVY